MNVTVPYSLQGKVFRIFSNDNTNPNSNPKRPSRRLT